MTPSIFTHPPQLHRRRHGPRGYNPYNGFKDWLRDEFQFRCVYCLEREMWYPDRAASFSVDHVVPQSEDRTLICEYGNLVYACTRCNSGKQEIRLLDPTAAAFGKHIRLGKEGLFVGLTAEVQDIIDLLSLNENPALKVRRWFLCITKCDRTTHRLVQGVILRPPHHPPKCLREPTAAACSGVSYSFRSW